jgi:hypothetical protein
MIYHRGHRGHGEEKSNDQVLMTNMSEFLVIEIWSLIIWFFSVLSVSSVVNP